MKKAILLVVIGLTIGVFASPVAERFYRHVKHYYFSEPRTERGAIYYDARVGIFSMSSLDRADVVMFGDSNTELGKWREWTGCNSLVNRGIGGDTTEGMLKRIDSVLALKPKAIFFMGGINDVVKAVPFEKTVANLDAIMARLSRSGAKVYMNYVFKVSDTYQKNGWPNQFIDDLNAEISRLANKYPSITMIDLTPDLAPGGSINPSLVYDGMHLIDAGYRIWLAHVIEHINRRCHTE